MSQRFQNRLMTGLEVARAFGVSPETIRKWARQGKLRAVRLSARCLRYSSDEIAELLAGTTKGVRRG